MPNKNSAKKALRQAKKRTLENNIVKTEYKKAIKAVEKAIEAGKDTKEAIVLAQKKIDKAAKKGILKKNTASRKISQLMKKVTKK